MINVNELRIGNWFIPCLFDDEQLEPRPLKARDFFALSENPNWGKPITLTEEWLLKFGFEQDKKYKYWRIGGFVLNLKEDGRYYLWHIGIFPLDYVHQLQNLYFELERKELTIKE